MPLALKSKIAYIYRHHLKGGIHPMDLKKYDIKPTALLAELVGTFILATVAVTVANPLIVGFTLVVLVLAIGAVSGSHVNPAVTFGFWSVKKINTVKALFYWAMQFIGAFLALLVAQMFQGSDYGISFASFTEFDSKIVVAELLGAAIFTFAVAAAIQQKLLDAAKSLCVGLGLLTGLAVGGGLLGQATQNLGANAQQGETPRAAVVDGVTVNPAIALASTEKAQASQLSQFGLGQEEKETPRPASRLGLETIIGTLVGGALGMNLYFVVKGENPFEKKGVKATIARVFKRGEKKAKQTAKKASKKAKK